jgi:predicted  nucleic acid-binding Zn-ribbon protein
LKASLADQNNLIELQRIDAAISALQHKLKKLPEHELIAAVQKRKVDAEVTLVEAEAELADVAIDLKRSELEVETVSDRIKKDEARLNSGQGSPKDLEQTQHEIATLEKRKSELEDAELEIMMRHDAAHSKVETMKSDLQGLDQMELELNIRFENSKTEIERDINLKNSERILVLPKIVKELLDLYEKVREQSGGVGAALLLGNVCEGCRIEINAIELERIKNLDSEEVVRCEECRRILVRI